MPVGTAVMIYPPQTPSTLSMSAQELTNFVVTLSWVSGGPGNDGGDPNRYFVIEED